MDGKVKSITTCKKIKQKQRSRFLQEYKSKTSYTPEDGHIGRNMWCKQWQLNVRQWNIYNKAARRRQHNLKTYWTIQCSRMLKYSTIYKPHTSCDQASEANTRSQHFPFRSLIRISAWTASISVNIVRMVQKVWTMLILTSLIITEFQKVYLRVPCLLRRIRGSTMGSTVTFIRKAYPIQGHSELTMLLFEFALKF
jgi:hypothetical protein